MSNDHEILADRLNAEPAIFKGCSSSELGMIVGLAIVVWLPFSLLLAWLLGAITMGFGIAGVGVAVPVGRHRFARAYHSGPLVWLESGAQTATCLCAT